MLLRLVWSHGAGEREAMRALAAVLSGGADALAAERRDTDWGAAREGAVLGALRLLRCAFELDTPMIAALRQGEQSGGLCGFSDESAAHASCLSSPVQDMSVYWYLYLGIKILCCKDFKVQTC